MDIPVDQLSECMKVVTTTYQTIFVQLIHVVAGKHTLNHASVPLAGVS